MTPTTVVLCLVACALLRLVQTILGRQRSEHSLDHIPTHSFPDGDNSRQRYLHSLRLLLESGYRQYNKADKAFKIKIPIGGYAVRYRVILPKSHIEEIKHLSNNVFSWQLASRIIFAQDYTGAPDRGQWSGKALRVGIHQNLGDITRQLNQRIADYFSTHLPQHKGSVNTLDFMEFFIPTVTYVTNTLLVDSRLSSDETWLKETADFAVTRYGAADDVRRWPPYLSAIVAQMIPSVRRLRRQREYVMEKLRPLYNELKAAGHLDPNDKKARQRGALGYEWLWGGAPDTVTLRDFSDTMMRTMIAAIHTTAKTISIALIDMLADPELLEELRDEAIAATSADGSQIDIERLVKLDCFLKESQRLSPVFLFTMNRIVTQEYTFKCSGLKLPKGTMVTAPAAAIATDPDIFPHGDTFDGYRYRRLREQSTEGASALVLGMSTIDSLGFGLGNQACPGRFLAVNNLKLMMARLLAGWELGLERHGEEYRGPRPVIGYNDFSVVPPKEYRLRVRRL
ncbi:cytochrome P450 [Aspergillus californicus]